MIVSFRHKGLEWFFTTGSKAGIKPEFAPKLKVQLSALDAANDVSQMGVPSWDLHPLQGDLADHWAVKVNKNWRMTFKFVGENAEVVDLQDYH